MKGNAMTIKEFKAWLEGFEEAMGGAPTPEQWAKIRAKIETLSDGTFKYQFGVVGADEAKRNNEIQARAAQGMAYKYTPVKAS